MISIFYADYEKERLEKERLLKARKKAHEEELIKLGITEEEFQEQERKRKEQEEIDRKKENKKVAIIISLFFVFAIIVYVLITAVTHSSIMAGLFGFVVGMLILIYIPFFLGWVIEKSLKKSIEFNGWLVLLSIIFSGTLGLFTATGIYNAMIYEYGDESIVYVTPEGYCYHRDKDCFEIKGHVVRARSYGSVKNHKRPCEVCSK